MSHSPERQVANPSQAADEVISDDLHPPPHLHQDPRLEESTLLRQSAGARTKLHFEYGANTYFKLLYASFTLMGKPYNVDEQMANIYYSKYIIRDAERENEEQLDPADRDRLTEAIEALKTRVELCISDDEFQHGVRQRVVELQTFKPPAVQNLNDVSLEQWHSDACMFLKHAKPFADRLNIASDLSAARNTVIRMYQAALQFVEDNSLFVDNFPVASSGWTEWVDSQRTSTLERFRSRMGKTEENTQETVRLRFAGLFHTYDALSLLMRDYKINSFSVSNLADALESVKQELSYLFGRNGSGKSLYDEHLDIPEYEAFVQGCCHALSARALSPVHDVLGDMFRELCDLTLTEQPALQLEKNFADLAKLADTLAMRCPSTVEKEKWEQYAPKLLEDEEIWYFMNKLQILYASFQKKTYNKEERSKLWLAIWRGLKAVYLIVRKNNFQLESLFPAEQAFFNKESIRHAFNLVIIAPDPLNPVAIENIITEYCLHIAECRQTSTPDYRLLQLLPTTIVQDLALDSIDTLVDTQTWSDLAMRAIEKCAIRLNHIEGGAACIRRLDRQQPTNLIHSAADWIVERIIVQADQIPSTTHSQPPSIPLERGSTSAGATTNTTLPTNARDSEIRPGTGTRTDQVDDDTDNRIQPGSHNGGQEAEHIDGGMNIISAFDYVSYPFPETRALEVAYSRQITREMSQSGIYSQGALVEDVTNRPPRHTWPPGKISIWAQPLPIDPISIARYVWRGFRHRRSATPLVTPARPYPSITPRRPRKEWANQHPRLQPLRDLNNRVTKPMERAGRIHHDPMHSRLRVPKLRGGGPKIAPSNQQITPSRPVSTTDGFITRTERIHRMQAFRDRLGDAWSTYDMPPMGDLYQNFLVPNKWDVDAAIRAFHRFLNSETVGGNAMTPDHHQHHHHHRPADDTDPFGPARTNNPPTIDPRVHGMPTTQGPILPWGRHGVRVEPLDSPSVATRRARAVRGLFNYDTFNYDHPLMAHMSGAQDQAPSIVTTPVDPQAVFRSTGLSQSFAVYEDPSVGNTPVPPGLNDSLQPAGNQEQQAHIDRERAGIPPHRLSDNSSNQENRAAVPGSIFATPSRAASIRQALTRPVTVSCDDPVCHPCPQYHELVHHVCRNQQNRRQQTPSTSTSSRPTRTPQSHPQPPTIDDSPFPISSNNDNTRQPLQSILQSSASDIQQTQQRSSTPTQIGGHNLRNRTSLAQQRQDGHFRNVHFDDIQTPAQTQQNIVIPESSPPLSRSDLNVSLDSTQYEADIDTPSPVPPTDTTSTSAINAAQALADAAAATAAAALAAITAMSGSSSSPAFSTPTPAQPARKRRRNTTRAPRKPRSPPRSSVSRSPPSSRTRDRGRSANTPQPTTTTTTTSSRRSGRRTKGRGKSVSVTDDGDTEYTPDQS